jgi:HK97 family phage portal protein
MKLFGFEFGTKGQGDTYSIDQIIARLDAALTTASGVVVTPDTAEESPTVQAIVNAIAMHFQALPVHVFKQTVSEGKVVKERLPNHSVAKLLARPNSWQTSADYFGDSAATFVKHGKFFAVKGQGMTGPIRSLTPVHPSCVVLEQDSNMNVTARITTEGGMRQRVYEMWEVHHVRQRSADFLNGDSPVFKAKDAIALEIAAQRFGSEFFGNGAMPGMVFKYLENFRGHTSEDQRKEFIRSVEASYGKGKRFRAMLLPHGIEEAQQVEINNDKAQFLDTRKLQRNIIAGAFGVPPHLVGDLERGTFSNIEHQSQEFLNKVILPYARIFEAAMERDLLSDDDRRMGVVIRFNLDAIQRADFKTRQEGMKIQREMGVINANEWREREGMNPREGGEEYYEQGPSGQNMGAAAPASGASDEPAPKRPA